MDLQIQQQTRWSLARRLLFRFMCSYLFLYAAPGKALLHNLLFMAVFLLAPNLRCLGQLLLFNRRTGPADLSQPTFHWRWARSAALGLQTLFVGYYLFGQARGGWTAYAQTHLLVNRGSRWINEVPLNR